MRPQRIVESVAALPTYGLGPRMTPWWGTLGFCALEGMGFALAIGIYLYLVQVNAQWPLDAPPPNHWSGSVLTVLLLVSLWPNRRASRDAQHEDLPAVRRNLLIMSAIGALVVAIRFYEFAHLNVKWDQNAYGSITWIILGLHATHIITDVADTLVVTSYLMLNAGARDFLTFERMTLSPDGNTLFVQNVSLINGRYRWDGPQTFVLRRMTP